ncbi:MAG: omptin family outer membrane protease [Candidatus Omnitrophota bacterium]|nr:omptin family outer membrane protease [Candidatus Omnitrophota bacterium]
MNKSNTLVSAFLILGLLIPPFVFSYSDSRETAIQDALDVLKGEPALARTVRAEEESVSSPFFKRHKIIGETLDEIELEVTLKIGYIAGDTTYDFDNHVSELMFPFDNWMGGANVNAGFKKFSLNIDFWAPIDKEANSKMTDKDWFSATLISSTESRADMDAVIAEGYVRYDFYEGIAPRNIEPLALLASDGIKLGALIGYKYERFDYDLYDLYDRILGVMSYQDEHIGTYKIQYYFPYVGLAADILRKEFKFSMNLKYSPLPTAKDVDNHLLRSLTFYGDYDKPKYAFMFGIEGIWGLMHNWNFGLGLDGTFARIDGITWDETRNPAWDKDQFTKLTQVLFWSELKYRF